MPEDPDDWLPDCQPDWVPEAPDESGAADMPDDEDGSACGCAHAAGEARPIAIKNAVVVLILESPSGMLAQGTCSAAKRGQRGSRGALEMRIAYASSMPSFLRTCAYDCRGEESANKVQQPAETFTSIGSLCSEHPAGCYGQAWHRKC
jgi:hypothetical protein